MWETLQVYSSSRALKRHLLFAKKCRVLSADIYACGICNLLQIRVGKSALQDNLPFSLKSYLDHKTHLTWVKALFNMLLQKAHSQANKKSAPFSWEKILTKLFEDIITYRMRVGKGMPVILAPGWECHRGFYLWPWVGKIELRIWDCKEQSWGSKGA